MLIEEQKNNLDKILTDVDGIKIRVDNMHRGIELLIAENSELRAKIKELEQELEEKKLTKA